VPRSERHFDAWCERDGRAWSVGIPDPRVHTYGYTLGDAEEMARDAIAGVLDVPIDTVSVTLHVDEVDDQLRRRAALEPGPR
jgi:predicted RNase H-like HicB family nuclease